MNASLSTASYCAAQLGRRSAGCELNAERQALTPTLFALEGIGQPTEGPQ